jgi:hypothetical protein
MNTQWVSLKIGRGLVRAGVSLRCYFTHLSRRFPTLHSTHLLRRTPLLFSFLTLLFIGGCAYQVPMPQQTPESTANVADMTLPSPLYGCWEGTFDHLDSVTPLSFSGYFVSRGMTVTYQMCAQPKPGGGAQVDLTKVVIQGKEATVTHFYNRVTAHDEKRRTASLENHVTAVSVVRLLWIFPVSVPQDIFAQEDLVMKTDDVVFVQGKQRAQVNGQDIAEMTFHADFHRVPGVLGKSNLSIGGAI